MVRRAWVRLDNASNIFLAARTDADPKVFRLAAEMDHDVDPTVLQAALDATFVRYPLYRAVLRRGVFWHYLQDSDLHPEVAEDTLQSCAAIYDPEVRTLLFRVVYRGRRIALEVFHALSDGTGALWFLTDLVTEYVRLLEREEVAAPNVPAEPSEPEGAEPTEPSEPAAPTTHELAPDSFGHYFRRRRADRVAEKRAAKAAQAEQARQTPAGQTSKQRPDDDEFSEAATPALLTVAPPPPPATGVLGAPPVDDDRDHPHGTARPGRSTDADDKLPPVYRVRGTRTPDLRTRAVELTMPAAPVLSMAKAAGASPTMFLTAMFFESIRRAVGDLGEARTMAASVPVNLRQFFPSDSARNFFATVRVHHVFGTPGAQDSVTPGSPEADTVPAIARALDEQFWPQASPEALERKLRRFIRLERSPALRVMPRPLKDLILRTVNAGNNRGLTVAVSNLGRVVLPGTAEQRVGRMPFHVTAVRPQFCVMSHAGQMMITFTSPFTETDHIREFARMLTADGVEVQVAAARVTEEELDDTV